MKNISKNINKVALRLRKNSTKKVNYRKTRNDSIVP